MAHLPPVTWNEVATKDDLDMLGTTLRSEVRSMETSLRGEMRTGFAMQRAEFVEGVNRQIKWMVTLAAAWTTLLVTLVRRIP